MKPLELEGGEDTESLDAPQKPLVLYVEDDDENWNVTQLRLQGKFRLIRAATDIQACDAVRTHANSLHAILMDIELKGSKLSGIDLTKAFRQKLEHSNLPAYAKELPLVTAPIVFVTAYGYRYKAVDLLAMGGNQVVDKPVDFAKLSLALVAFQKARNPPTP
jgi:CheY-like chemotaxis protein